jgi:hypothetical protein
VYASKKRWRANINTHNLGTFVTKQEAALAYDRAAMQCGEDKPLNYESITAAEEAAVQAQAAHILVHPQQPKPRPASGFYGVYVSKMFLKKGNNLSERWAAKISCGSKQRSLGYFDTKQEAALAYDRAARQCGEDKPLNYESIAAAEEAAVQAQAEHILVHDMCAGPNQPKPRPTSGFYGVSANKKRWQAQIKHDSNTHNLGTFDTKSRRQHSHATGQRGSAGSISC